MVPDLKLFDLMLYRYTCNVKIVALSQKKKTKKQEPLLIEISPYCLCQGMLFFYDTKFLYFFLTFLHRHFTRPQESPGNFHISATPQRWGHHLSWQWRWREHGLCGRRPLVWRLAFLLPSIQAKDSEKAWICEARNLSLWQMCQCRVSVTKILF